MTLLVAVPPRTDVLHIRARTRAVHERLMAEMESQAKTDDEASGYGLRLAAEFVSRLAIGRTMASSVSEKETPVNVNVRRDSPERRATLSDKQQRKRESSRGFVETGEVG